MRLFTRDTKVEALGRAPIFDGLSRKELNDVARLTDDLEAEPGAILCKEGEIGREFFVIVDGEAEITRNGKRIATVKGGDFFGEIALVEDVRRTATVKAKTPLRFFVMTRQAFVPLLDTQPSVERKVLRALARRVMELSNEDNP